MDKSGGLVYTTNGLELRGGATHLKPYPLGTVSGFGRRPASIWASTSTN